MAGKVQNISGLALYELHRKLIVLCSKTATNHIRNRWAQLEKTLTT